MVPTKQGENTYRLRRLAVLPALVLEHLVAVLVGGRAIGLFQALARRPRSNHRVLCVPEYALQRISTEPKTSYYTHEKYCLQVPDIVDGIHTDPFLPSATGQAGRSRDVSNGARARTWGNASGHRTGAQLRQAH